MRTFDDVLLQDLYFSPNIGRIKIKLNLWLTAPRGAITVNLSSVTDWDMVVRRDNMISIMLC